MSDIVEKLKDACVVDPNYGKSVTLTLDYDDYMEAADLITALRVENGRLRRALEFYAAWPQSPSGNMAALLVDAGHKARAALEEKQ